MGGRHVPGKVSRGREHAGIRGPGFRRFRRRGPGGHRGRGKADVRRGPRRNRHGAASGKDGHGTQGYAGADPAPGRKGHEGRRGPLERHCQAHRQPGPTGGRGDADRRAHRRSAGEAWQAGRAGLLRGQRRGGRGSHPDRTGGHGSGGGQHGEARLQRLPHGRRGRSGGLSCGCGHDRPRGRGAGLPHPPGHGEHRQRPRHDPSPGGAGGDDRHRPGGRAEGKGLFRHRHGGDGHRQHHDLQASPSCRRTGWAWASWAAWT